MRVAIYTLNCPRTGRVRYVGKSARPARRLQAHIDRCRDGRTHKNLWIRALLGRDERPKLEILEWVLSSEWESVESEYIRVFRAIGMDLTNALPGGEGRAAGCRISLETRVRMRLAKTGRRHSEESKRKIAEAHIGMRASEETRKKLSIVHRVKTLERWSREPVRKFGFGKKK